MWCTNHMESAPDAWDAPGRTQIDTVASMRNGSGSLSERSGSRCSDSLSFGEIKSYPLTANAVYAGRSTQVARAYQGKKEGRASLVRRDGMHSNELAQNSPEIVFSKPYLKLCKVLGPSSGKNTIVLPRPETSSLPVDNRLGHFLPIRPIPPLPHPGRGVRG